MTVVYENNISVWGGITQFMFQNKQFHYSPFTYTWGSHVTGLTSDDLREKIRDMQNVSIRELATVWRLHLPDKDCLTLTKLRHFVTVQRFTYDVIGQWCDFTWKWKKNIMSCLNGVSVMPSSNSPSQTAPGKLWENRWGKGGTPLIHYFFHFSQTSNLNLLT